MHTLLGRPSKPDAACLCDTSSCGRDDDIKGDGVHPAESIDVPTVQTRALTSIWTNTAPLLTQPWAEHLTYIGGAAREETETCTEPCAASPFPVGL